MLRAALAATACVVPLGAALVGSEVRFNWLPEVIEDFALGQDPDLAAVDWSSLRVELARRGELRPGTTIAATRWNDAGKIDYALRGAATVICLGGDPREYGLTQPAARHSGENLLIVTSRGDLAWLSRRFGGYFDRIDEMPPVLIRHAGRPGMLLHVFRAYDLHVSGTRPA